jgi:ATP-dependent DNA ligase
MRRPDCRYWPRLGSSGYPPTGSAYRSHLTRVETTLCVGSRATASTGATAIRASARLAGPGAASATIDGEAVWCDGEGLAIFDKLHSRAYDGEVSLYVFDLLGLDGRTGGRGHSSSARQD